MGNTDGSFSAVSFSLGLEVLEAVPEPHVVVVCCGGGGLLAGVAAAIRLSGREETRIYGVEPEGGVWGGGGGVVVLE